MNTANNVEANELHAKQLQELNKVYFQRLERARQLLTRTLSLIAQTTESQNLKDNKNDSNKENEVAPNKPNKNIGYYYIDKTAIIDQYQTLEDVKFKEYLNQKSENRRKQNDRNMIKEHHPTNEERADRIAKLKQSRWGV